MSDDKYSKFDGQYAVIPSITQYALTRYVTEGQDGGDFITAVLENNLQQAFAHADLDNVEAMDAIVKWIYNRAPGSCWGDREKVRAWYTHHGMKGLECQL